MTKPTLSILVPVFNEEEVIHTFITALEPHLVRAFNENNLEESFEIVFVDDGSSDATVSIIKEVSQDNKNVKLVKLSRNFGKDIALTAGLRYTKGKAVIPMDVDLQDPPEIITEMVKHWLAGAKIVNAQRANRDSDTAFKRATSSYFYKLYNKIAHTKIDENVGDYRLLDRLVVDEINKLPERIRFMKGIFSWVGYPKATVQYVRQERVAGTSKWQYWNLWNFALDGIIGATTLPLRIWTYLGALSAFLAFFYALFVVVKTIFFGNDVAGYPSLMVAILFFGGLNMMATGIIGEYVGRISVEVRNRPVFIVEETTNI